MNKRVVWAVTVALVLIGGIAAGVRLLFPSKFDPVRWQSVDSPQSYQQRRQMLPDVRKLIGDGTIATRDAALRQLGHPQQGADTDDVWLYDLGSQTSANVPGPHDWLELRFDASDRVVTNRVVQEPTSEVNH